MRNQYILLTAAKNEADYIGEAIKSVLRQSVLRWLGSLWTTAPPTRRRGLLSALPCNIHSSGSFLPEADPSAALVPRTGHQRGVCGRPNLWIFDFIGIFGCGHCAGAERLLRKRFCAGSKAMRGFGIAGGYIYERSNAHGKPKGKFGGFRCRRRANVSARLLRSSGRLNIPMHHAARTGWRRSSAHGRLEGSGLPRIFTSFIIAPRPAPRPMARSVSGRD